MHVPMIDGTSVAILVPVTRVPFWFTAHIDMETSPVVHEKVDRYDGVHRGGVYVRESAWCVCVCDVRCACVSDYKDALGVVMSSYFSLLFLLKDRE